MFILSYTFKNMAQAAQIFGPAQTAVARAVADSVQEGVIPEDQLEELTIVVSVFIHPEAKDYNKIDQSRIMTDF